MLESISNNFKESSNNLLASTHSNESMFVSKLVNNNIIII